MSAPTTSRPARSTVATRGILAALHALHGYAHFVGTATNLHLLDEHSPGRLIAWQITNPAFLVTQALLWAAIGAGFMITAALVGMANPPARTAARVLAALSLAVCVTNLWATWIGVLLDLAILVAVSYPTEPGNCPELPVVKHRPMAWSHPIPRSAITRSRVVCAGGTKGVARHVLRPRSLFRFEPRAHDHAASNNCTTHTSGR